MTPSPKQRIAHIALVVADYDEALAFYVGKLGFTVVEDTYQPAQDKRWVVIAPPGSGGADGRGGTTLLLARASSGQEAFVGNQAGGRVFLFLETDDFWRDHAAMLAAGVEFVRPPAAQPYGTVAVFVDLYGTKWDLVQFGAVAAPLPPPSAPDSEGDGGAITRYPPAIAPTTRKGSVPAATAAGSGSSGDWCDTSSAQAKKRRKGRRPSAP